MEPEKFPDYARHNRAGVPVDRAPESFSATPLRLEGNYVFGGLLLHHFGHVVTECLHRLWLTELPEFSNWPVLFVRTSNSKKGDILLAQAMAHFGITNYKLVCEDTLVETLAIGEMGKQFQKASRQPYSEWLERRISLTAMQDPHFPKKLCVMRSHLPGQRLMGEATIVNWLASDGYHILHPEDHDIATQAKYYANAEKIVFSEGSAIHFLDLLPRIKADVAVLLRRPGSLLPRTSLAGKVGSLYVFSNVVQVLDLGNGSNSGLSFAPLGEVAQFLQQNGFLSTVGSVNLFEEAPYTHDIETYSANVLHKASPLEGVPSHQAERAMEDVLLAYRGRVNALRKTRAELLVLQAQQAINSADYTKAEQLAKRAQRQAPSRKEIDMLLVEIFRKKRRAATPLGKVWQKIRNIFG